MDGSKNDIKCPGKHILSQYCNIRQEIKETLEEIERLEACKTEVLQGVVKGSSHEFPYTAKTYMISGYDDYTRGVVLNELQKKHTILAERNLELMRLETQVVEWINAIEDSYIRRIFRMRYLNNMTWVKIADQIGGGNTADTCRMAHNRFLKRQ